MNTNMMMPAQTLGCPPGTLPGGLTRTRFFDGMFLTQADLENEQVYWRMKRRLTNRALGTGVVWGLRLTFDQPTQRYRLSPGYALDCCGNDLIVECPVDITQTDLFQRSQAALTTQPQLVTGAVNNTVRACVILQYVECPDAIRPVHRDACSPPGSSCEPSRIRESCRLLLVAECADKTGCDPIVKFTKKVDEIKAKLGVQPEAPRASWAPSATYRGGQQTIGTWLLLAMRGYLATAEKYKASAEAQLIMSYLASNVLTGLLDIDVANLGTDLGTQLDDAVAQLSSDLCSGLLYPGPRCQDEHHGVYLGCVTMTRTGAVVGFEPWTCRREVLTGPLINWWLCQLGGFSLDVLFNQIVASSCDQVTNGDDGVILKVAKLTDAVSGTVTNDVAMPTVDFLATIARAITARPDAAGLVKVGATAPNGRAMTMVVPAAAVAPTETASPVARLANDALVADRAVQPLSRGPLRDVVVRLAAATPVASIATGVDPNTVKVLGKMMVADLLATEPEAALAKLGRARPTDAQRAAVNSLYSKSEDFVREVTAATAPAGRAGVTRDQLKTSDVKTALKRVAGTSGDAIEAALDAASKP